MTFYAVLLHFAKCCTLHIKVLRDCVKQRGGVQSIWEMAVFILFQFLFKYGYTFWLQKNYPCPTRYYGKCCRRGGIYEACITEILLGHILPGSMGVICPTTVCPTQQYCVNLERTKTSCSLTSEANIVWLKMETGRYQDMVIIYLGSFEDNLLLQCILDWERDSLMSLTICQGTRKLKKKKPK